MFYTDKNTSKLLCDIECFGFYVYCMTDGSFLIPFRFQSLDFVIIIFVKCFTFAKNGAKQNFF